MKLEIKYFFQLLRKNNLERLILFFFFLVILTSKYIGYRSIAPVLEFSPTIFANSLLAVKAPNVIANIIQNMSNIFLYSIGLFIPGSIFYFYLNNTHLLIYIRSHDYKIKGLFSFLFSITYSVIFIGVTHVISHVIASSPIRINPYQVFIQILLLELLILLLNLFDTLGLLYLGYFIDLVILLGLSNMMYKIVKISEVWQTVWLVLLIAGVHLFTLQLLYMKEIK